MKRSQEKKEACLECLKILKRNIVCCNLNLALIVVDFFVESTLLKSLKRDLVAFLRSILIEKIERENKWRNQALTVTSPCTLKKYNFCKLVN